MKKCYNNSLYVADKYNWNKINCIKDNKILSVEKIHSYIYNLVIEKLNFVQ